MRKPFAFLLAGLAAVAVWFFFDSFEIEGIDGVRVRPREDLAPAPSDDTSQPPVERHGKSLRIASFNVQVFGTSKADKPHVMDILARVVRRFDIVAIQEVRSRSADVVPRLVDLVNMTGRQYDYVIGERVGRTSNQEQYAFLFDRASVEVDRDQLYTVDDPDDLLHREPFVAWFRTRGPAADEAFTFTLVNVHTDPDEVAVELEALDDVFHAVRADGRNEDDVILVGDFNTDHRRLGQLGEVSGITWALAGIPTNTRGTKEYDNLIFQKQATSEFNGRAGVFDFMRKFNMTLDAALEVSDHMPVWAEFSIYEGGEPGRVAARPADRAN